MDPECCWNRLLDALMNGDEDESSAAAEDLAGWIKKRGFAPNGLKDAERDRYVPGTGKKLSEIRSS